MKMLLLGVAMAACPLADASADPAIDALKAKAEACMTSKAPDVAAKAENVTDAVGALSWVCGVEIARVDAYDKNARTLADWEGRSSSTQLAGVSLDPVTGELRIPPGFKIEWDSSSATVSDLGRVTPRDELNAFATRAVLAVRKPMKDQ